MAFSLFSKETKQWKVVVVAFLAATTFWFFNALNKDYSTTLNYPIEFVYNEDSLIAVKPVPESIGLEVTGGGWNLLRRTALFRPKPLKIEVTNPSGASSVLWKDYESVVRAHFKDLRINLILQDTMRVEFQERVARMVPVSLDTSALQLQAGYLITGPVSLRPESVQITGPTGYFDTLSGPVKVTISEVLSGDHTGEVRINPGLSSLRIVPDRVKVALSIESFEWREMQIPLNPAKFPGATNITASVVDLRYLVPVGYADTLEVEDFTVVGDYGTFQKADSTVRLSLEKPPKPVRKWVIEPGRLKILR